MQRRLILMRHAKSSWDHDVDDALRPLNPRGKRDAPRVAGELLDRGWLPERVVSSDSERTRQTWAGMATVLGAGPQVRFTNTLYLAPVQDILGELAQLSDTTLTAMLLGHNPGSEDTLEQLTGQSLQMGTAYAALLTTQSDSWALAAQAQAAWSLNHLIRPRALT